MGGGASCTAADATSGGDGGGGAGGGGDGGGGDGGGGVGGGGDGGGGVGGGGAGGSGKVVQQSKVSPKHQEPSQLQQSISMMSGATSTTVHSRSRCQEVTAGKNEFQLARETTLGHRRSARRPGLYTLRAPL